MPTAGTAPTTTARTLIAAVIGAAAASGSAFAQSNEYKLDDSLQWVRVAAPEPGTDEAVIAEARRLLAEERPAAAQELLDQWIRENDRTSKPELAAAYLLRGDALTAQGYEFKALYDYEAVIKRFPATEEFVRANERELDIAVRYANGYRRKFLGMRILATNDIGEELLIRVQERMPSSRLAERAGIELGDYYYRNRDMEMAAEAYGLFVQNYPRSPYLMKAMKRRIYSTIARFKGPAYDGTVLLDAQVLIRQFSSLYPAEAQKEGLDDALLARLDESAAEQMLQSAKWYLDTGDHVSAKFTLSKLIHAHPRTAAAAEALSIQTGRGWVAEPNQGRIGAAADSSRTTP